MEFFSEREFTVDIEDGVNGGLGAEEIIEGVPLNQADLLAEARALTEDDEIGNILKKSPFLTHYV